MILWSARISGTLVLGFILFFLGSHLFLDNESGNGFQSIKEIAMFINFPILVMIGLVVAYKNELLGGVLSTLGFAMLFLLEPKLADPKDPILLVTSIPGLLYITFHVVQR